MSYTPTSDTGYSEDLSAEDCGLFWAFKKLQKLDIVDTVFPEADTMLADCASQEHSKDDLISLPARKKRKVCSHNVAEASSEELSEPTTPFSLRYPRQFNSQSCDVHSLSHKVRSAFNKVQKSAVSMYVRVK